MMEKEWVTATTKQSTTNYSFVNIDSPPIQSTINLGNYGVINILFGIINILALTLCFVYAGIQVFLSCHAININGKLLTNCNDI